MMKPLIGLLILLWMPVASADCISLNLSGWEQGKINLLQAMSYQLIYASGINEVPKINGDQVCVQNPAIDLGAILTPLALDGAYSAHMQDNLKAEQDAIALKAQHATDLASAKQKLKGLGLTDDEISMLQEAP